MTVSLSNRRRSAGAATTNLDVRVAEARAAVTMRARELVPAYPDRESLLRLVDHALALEGLRATRAARRRTDAGRGGGA
jgi:hypothetical protein